MRKWLWRLTLASFVVLVLIALAYVGALRLLRGSLAQLDGRRELPGLSAPATISRDINGTVTIDAASEADAMRALGFVHAQERYFEMDLMRRSAAGELAELVGDAALATDKRHRVHRLRARVEAGMASIVGEKGAVLDAYVNGVNAGLDALRARPWPYLLLRQSPLHWRAEDSPLVAYAMYFDLQGGEDADALALWRMRPYLPKEIYALLTRDGSRWDAPLQGAPRGDAALPEAYEVQLGSLPAATGLPARTEPAGAPGSNQFAVAGPLTRDRRALLANDMHLTLRAPNIWFRARLRYPDPAAPGGKVDVQGLTLPGLPLVVAGSNGHIAWGFTNSYVDTMDWKVETPCDTRRTDGCASLSSHLEMIEVANGKLAAVEVQETEWGPVLATLPDGRVLTLRWVAHLPGAVNLGLGRLATAADVDAALAMADDIAMPTQNLMLADSKGGIAWRLLGPIPQRAETCTEAATVEDPAHESCPPWTLTTRGHVVLRSPQHDRLWTANARVLDGPDLARVGDGGYALGARAAQIRDDLQGKPQFDERDLLAIQLDDRALLLAPWQALLLERARAAGTPALRALADAAFLWEGRASVDSVSYRIVRAWRLAVEQRILAGLTAPARQALGKDFTVPNPPQFEGVVWPLVTQRPDNLLPRGYASWDALFESAAKEVQGELRAIGPLAQRTWGERNTAAICHPLARAIPRVGRRWLCMPAEPLAGDGNMPRVTAPDFGASERMVVSPGHEVDGILHMPGGQSGHPLSPFWGAGHAEWVAGSVSSFLPGPTRYTLTLVPAAH